MSTEMKYSPFVSRLKQMEEYCKNKSMNNEAKTLSSFDSITQYTMKVQVESTPQQEEHKNKEDSPDLDDKCYLHRGDTFGNKIQDIQKHIENRNHNEETNKNIEESKAEQCVLDSMTSSMPSPIDEFSEEFYVDASSCIHEGDEGTLRKPALLLINTSASGNVARRTIKVAASDIKTANDSDINDSININNNGQNESFISNKDHESLKINSSWEVVEENSIVIEVNNSSMQDSNLF